MLDVLVPNCIYVKSFTDLSIHSLRRHLFSISCMQTVMIKTNTTQPTSYTHNTVVPYVLAARGRVE